MTPHGIVQSATLADAKELEGKLRKADRRELEELTGKPALRSLQMAVLLGGPAWSLRAHNGDLAGILSVVPHGASRGIVAMSGTTLIEQHRTSFLRGSRDVLRHLDRNYGFDTLLNVCDARNEVHVRWLRWLGFSIIRRIETYGDTGVPVYEFARINPNYV